MSSIEHYENFPVASWLCPARLRPAIVALYHFARTADDLADEGDAPANQRLADLAQYRADLQACLGMDSGTGLEPHSSARPNSHTNVHVTARAPISTRWPQVFNALQEAVQQHALPAQPLFDLLDAFEQDVAYTQAGQNYRDRVELLDYCRRSANPVGRLMLHLYGVHDATSLAQSDAICSALQLINFWQDRQLDVQRGRDYLPEGHTLAEELVFARALMAQGAPLVHRVPGRAGWELRAVVQGGLALLDKLDALQDQLGGDGTAWPRPRLHKSDALWIAWRCWRM
ncbi:squalene synthase HpnC [Limnohabitans sp. TS-CS-82]|uniref:squalene/phytoene synthase family protein n=1 Tax=Limnohabitans sp. TS-CS-82 TaxID=2094193 RepID=UPI000CF1C8A6|nr:squalene/phytoene synthase family protein [Limnohabitans sp. TS-CS-82]PQA84351.1 squalene synthase HpnC [Limnohabitans sp. TS-CS-82]